MKKIIFNLIVFVFICLQVQSQNPCEYEMNDYYSVKKEIKRRYFKKKNIDNEEKTLLKFELAQQISTRISVVSVSKTENTVVGNRGSFNSFSNRESYKTVFGNINNPEFKYCKLGRKYFVYCRVKKADFDTDLYNTLVSKVKVFDQTVTSLNRSSNTISETFNNSVENLKKDYYYIINGIDLVSRSPFIVAIDKQNITNEATSAIDRYFQLQNLLLENFEITLFRLEGLLQNNRYREISLQFPNWTIEKLNAIQRQKFVRFKADYESSLHSYIKKLRTDLNKAIRNRNVTTATALLEAYLKITFHQDNRKHYEQFKNRLAARLGYARTNLFFGINAGTSFKSSNNIENNALPTDGGNKINFNQILPSLNLGFKHYLSNPRKRLGVSFSYKTFSDRYIQSGDEINENPMKGFTALQVGIILGPIEVNHGPVQSSLDIKNLSLTSLKFGLFRSDKFYSKLSKSNYLEFFIFGDYLSDFGDNSFLQAGIGINYNLAFNRTAKY